VSDEPDTSASVRAGTRQVRRWSPGGPSALVSAAEQYFAGDPTDPDTFRWAANAIAVTAVVELHDVRRAHAAARAVRSIRSDAALLILCPSCDEARGDGTLARSGRLRDVLRLDVDEELQRLEAQRRLFCLREFAAHHPVLPIFVHSDPDPDALSSALAVQVVLRRRPKDAPIMTLAPITRPQNRRMSELLQIRVTEVSLEELRRFERVIVVDMQPSGIALGDVPRFAVIDHHPIESSYEADYVDIRPALGATATMLTQYLRAGDPRRVESNVATALLYGIKTDTGSLTRGVTAADVEAYAFLQDHADLTLLRRFERGSYSRAAARAFGSALANARIEGDVLVAYLGSIHTKETHSLADLADFCLDVDGVVWSVVCAFADDTFQISLRYEGRGPGAGQLAHRLSRDGSGGGHPSMARVVWPAAEARRRLRMQNDDAVIDSVMELVKRNIEASRASRAREKISRRR
jgi:nanoRNase/pAp phosphatase (c-di-AMP/oligoRNAs hydrolase)